MNIEKQSGLKKALLITVVVMLVLLVGWHLLFPALGLVIAVTALVWAVIIASVALAVIGVLLFYVLSGLGVLIICALGFAWFIGALVFAPFLFPFLLPLLVLLVFIAYVRRKRLR